MLTFTLVGTDGSAGADGGPRAWCTVQADHHHVLTRAGHRRSLLLGRQSKSIKRFTFGAKKAVVFIKPNSPTDEYTCVACHSVSRDGKVIAFAVSNLPHGENTSAIQTAPTDDPSMPFVSPAQGASPYYTPGGGVDDLSHDTPMGPTDHFGHNVALSPDGSLAAINGIAAPPTTSGWPPNFEIRDTKTGMTLGKWDMGDPLFGSGMNNPLFPEWSPDGKTIVATLDTFDMAKYGCGSWSSTTCSGSIVTMAYDKDTNTLSPPVMLVKNTAHRLPLLPELVARLEMDRLRVGAGRSGCRITRQPQGGSQDRPLDGWPLLRAPARSASTSSRARSTRGPIPSPETASTRPGRSLRPSLRALNGNKNLFFVTFTSMIPYGYLAKDKPELWSFFVDTDKLVFGKGDASFAPVWLPYQDINDGAISPYWTETLPCTVDGANNCIGCVQGEECEVNKDKATCQCTQTRIQ